LVDYQAKQGTAADKLQYQGFVGLAPDDVAVLIQKPPTDEVGANKIMNELIQSNSTNAFLFTHLMMNLWGTQAAYSNLKLTDMLTDEGAQVVDKLSSNKCVHVMADTFNAVYGDRYQSLVRPQISNSLAWVKAFIDGSVRPVKPVAPVIIFWGLKDTIVPPIMHELYLKQMCAMGGNVQRVQLPGEQTHFTTPGASATLFIPWIRDRFAGKPLVNGCPKD
jgi:hypothetical protein